MRWHEFYENSTHRRSEHKGTVLVAAVLIKRKIGNSPACDTATPPTSTIAHLPFASIPLRCLKPMGFGSFCISALHLPSKSPVSPAGSSFVRGEGIGFYRAALGENSDRKLPKIMQRHLLEDFPFLCFRTRTRTNTHPNDTEANAVGRNVRACVARKSIS